MDIVSKDFSDQVKCDKCKHCACIKDKVKDQSKIVKDRYVDFGET